MSDKTILIVGTYDTKQDELSYIAEVIHAQGGKVMTMDVSVLGQAATPTDVSKHDVAQEGGHSIQEAIDSGDENIAMQIMAKGAALTTARLYREGRIDGVLVLGGTMGTDLALDVCSALPIGVPKYIVSTVSFSPLIPPERLPADVQMILWAGGLYGLNSVCKASLSQAAGAVLGAARAAQRPTGDKPLIGMMSFGKTVLRYMVGLKPELEKRGYEVAVFHATGMGGRAFESLAAEGAFAAVLDFAPQEVGNHLMGSSITAGADRMTNAGKRGTPQIVSIGCYDLVDFVGWQPVPPLVAGQEQHAHNRLLSSVMMTTDQRRQMARTMCERLATAEGSTTLLLPLHGGNEWDRPGGPLSDPDGLAAFIEELRQNCPENVRLQELECHINDDAFCTAALKVFDDLAKAGLLSKEPIS